MNVQNMTSSNGNKVANQFIVTDEDTNEYFQSYNSMIVKKVYHSSDIAEENVIEILLDKKYWNFSNTTSKYRNKFLNETTKQTMAKIKSGEYKLVDLNPIPAPEKIKGAGVNLSCLNTEGMSK
tara:strand:+ start:131 stop:499 length:369 start_codon:yes stop_codon:yes gene_type:complete